MGGKQTKSRRRNSKRDEEQFKQLILNQPSMAGKSYEEKEALYNTAQRDAREVFNNFKQMPDDTRDSFCDPSSLTDMLFETKQNHRKESIVCIAPAIFKVRRIGI